MKNKSSWKEFLFTDIFIIKDGYYNKKPPFDNGSIPFLGASLFKNATTGFVSEEIIYKYDKVGNVTGKDKENRIFDGDCIAVVNNGTAVGKAYYQQHKFTCSHDVTPLYLKNQKISFELAMFLIPLIEKSGEPFKYANKWRPKRIRRSKIMLPVNSLGDPDWEFMIEATTKKIADFKSIDFNYFGNHSVFDFRNLNDLEWKQFRMTDIFTIRSGVRLTKADMKPGKIPFIGATDSNNGVTGFTSTTNNSLDSNVLGVNYNGSVVESFYHPYKAVFSDDVKRLKLKNHQNNRHILMFMKTIILQQKVKYAYGYKFNAGRMKEQILLLPIKDDGTPDYDFMEQYMKRQENKIIELINDRTHK